jgi:hypothetical protein
MPTKTTRYLGPRVAFVFSCSFDELKPLVVEIARIYLDAAGNQPTKYTLEQVEKRLAETTQSNPAPNLKGIGSFSRHTWGLEDGKPALFLYHNQLREKSDYDDPERYAAYGVMHQHAIAAVIAFLKEKNIPFEIIDQEE